MAEVAAAPSWHARVFELLAHVRSTGDHLLLLVPSRLSADCRSVLDEGDDTADVVPFADDNEALRNWLGKNVHAYGMKFSPQETLELATGNRIDAKPYLAYLRAKYGAGVAA